MKVNLVDAYLEATPQPHRKTLTALRQALRRLLPHAEEGMSYGMPCLKVDGKGVAGFAAFKAHCTYFPMSGSVVGTLKKELAAYRISKGGVPFAADKGLPPALVKKLVQARLRELSAPPPTGTGPVRSYYDSGVLSSVPMTRPTGAAPPCSSATCGRYQPAPSLPGDRVISGWCRWCRSGAGRSRRG